MFRFLRPPVLSTAEAAEKEAKAEKMLFARGFPIAGAVGLSVTLVTNAVAIVHFKKASAAYFSHGWWSNWFPNYLVWGLLLGMGLSFLRSKKTAHP
jgi:hypothetical protein